MVAAVAVAIATGVERVEARLDRAFSYILFFPAPAGFKFRFRPSGSAEVVWSAPIGRQGSKLGASIGSMSWLFLSIRRFRVSSFMLPSSLARKRATIGQTK